MEHTKFTVAKNIDWYQLSIKKLRNFEIDSI